MRLKRQSVLRVRQLEDRCLLSGNVILEWNQLALHAIGQARVSPVVASRVLAITEAAVYDGVVAIDREFEPYHAHVAASSGASPEAAAAQAAHDALAALFPSQASTFDAALAADLTNIPPGQARQGTAVGHEAARQILDWRASDGSSATVTYTPGTDPGDWQPTPPAFLPALAPQWPYVAPFAMASGDQFRPEAPPALNTTEYAAAFNEVENLGRSDSATRTDEQTQIALFWNDGLGTAFAPGYWNRIAQQVATDHHLGLVRDARLFALLNIASADALIACWDAKYAYNLWRPVTAIRAADTDGNPATDPDTTWTPLLTTPNFPSYVSAHSSASAAAAGVLTALLGPDDHFTVTAESLPGVTRSFDSFDAAAQEAGQSRIYGGIHYQFDNANGLALGTEVATYVMGNFLKPQDNDAHPLRPMLTETLARWQTASAAPSTLHGVDIRGTDLGGLTLGKATGGIIRLDDRAAGLGLYVDSTPQNDSEFTTPGNQGEAGRMDLFTVPEHEVGPLLGRGQEADGLMPETLGAGIGWVAGPTLVQDMGWFGAAHTLFAWDAETLRNG